MAMVLAACTPPGLPDNDAGVTTATDAGRRDAGSGGGTADSGMNPVDAGQATRDSGTPVITDAGDSRDSGVQPGLDAGQTNDAGTGPDFFDQPTLERRVGYLASDAMKGRDEGTAESALARQFIIDELTACGVAPQVPVSGGSPIFTQPERNREMSRPYEVIRCR